MRLQYIVWLLLAICAASSAEAADQNGLKAEFEATLSFGEGEASTLRFAGKLAWLDPKLRIDVSDALTQENNILLVDYAAQSALLLYPDTLNGYRASLKQFDQARHLENLKGMLNGEPPDTPDGWTRQQLGKEKVLGVQCSHVRFVNSQMHRVDIWLNSKNQPRKLSLTKQDLVIEVKVTKILEKQPLAASTFSYDKSYSISEYKSGQDPALSSL